MAEGTQYPEGRPAANDPLADRSASAPLLIGLRQRVIELALRCSLDKRLQEMLDQNADSFITWLRFLQDTYTDEDSPEFRKLSHYLGLAQQPSQLSSAEELLRAGLGLVFMPFNAALQEFYYHDVFCDLIPTEAISRIREVLSVPAGEGSIGGVIATVKRRLLDRQDQNQPLSSAESVVSLWSCFCDPRGRVATEDYILGNRSWVAVPLFDDETPSGSPATIGVVFSFFPADGLFPSVRTTSEADFRSLFAAEVQGSKESLLLALENEALSSLLRPLNLPQSPTDRSILELDAMGQRVSEAVRLLGHRDELPQPAGFLAAVEVEPSGFHTAALGRPFALRLFQLVRLAALLPGQVGLGVADSMAMLSSFASAVPRNDIFSLRWQDQDGGESSDHIRELYKLIREGTDRNSPSQVDPLSDSDREAYRCALAANSNRRAKPVSPIRTLLDSALSVYGAEKRVVDLIVPIAEHGATSWQGCMRINCIRSESNEPLLRLWKVGQEFILPICASAAGVMRDLSFQLKQEMGFERYKLLRDLEFVVAQAIAEGVATALTSDEGSAIPRLEVASDTGKRLGLEFSPLQQLTSALRELPHALIAERPLLPQIALVTVWSTGDRCTVLHSVPTENRQQLEEMFVADPGLPRLLSVLADFLPHSAGQPIDIDSSGAYCEFPERDHLTVPAIASSTESGYYSLSLKQSKPEEGKLATVAITLKSTHGVTILSEWLEQPYPVPLGLALGSGAAILSGLSHATGDAPSALRYLKSSTSRLGDPPMSLSSFRDLFPVAAELGPLHGLCSLATLFHGTDPTSGAAGLRILPLRRGIEVRRPHSSSAGQDDLDGILVTLSLGDDSTLLAALRSRSLWRLEADHRFRSVTSNLIAANTAHGIAKQTAHEIRNTYYDIQAGFDRAIDARRADAGLRDATINRLRLMNQALDGIAAHFKTASPTSLKLMLTQLVTICNGWGDFKVTLTAASELELADMKVPSSFWYVLAELLRNAYKNNSPELIGEMSRCAGISVAGTADLPRVSIDQPTKRNPAHALKRLEPSIHTIPTLIAESSGSGLGILLVRHIVEREGWELKFSFKGSLFSALLSKITRQR